VLHPTSAEDVAVAIRLAVDAGIGWFALGLGSNVLLPDEGMRVLVIRLGKGLDGIRQEGDRWTLGAGLPAPLAARRTAGAGFGGLHRMVGVPGTVGGGVYMNAGCHGAEWADVIASVSVVDPSGADRVLSRGEIPFAYRRSGLGDVVVLEVVARLSEADPTRLQEEVRDLFRWRQAGTPFNQPCCGSTFTNPSLPAPHPSGHRTAGQFLDGAGLKGVRHGGVEVSEMHANYFVNRGGGTAADVRALMVEARRRVQERFGVTLTPEVKVLGPDGRPVTEEGGA
jgi:UDP-N-acetylmuramate dehydrogenase